MEFPYMMRSAAVIISAANPQWANEEKTRINMTLTFADADLGFHEMGFTACPNDSVEHGPLLYQWALDQGNIKPWERRDVSAVDLQQELDKLLPDVMLGLATPEEMELAKLLRIQIKAMT
jgi:hypothetical protein